MPPQNPKIYHIAHIDRLPSIIEQGRLWCYTQAERRKLRGTGIGMNEIKERRRERILRSCSHLAVGQCVPFYFCPRSVMLYRIGKKKSPLKSAVNYTGGQDPIIHLEADLRSVVAWAKKNRRHWTFTSGNAGSRDFDEWCDLKHLSNLNWRAIEARYWEDEKQKAEKQAEFLIEEYCLWRLVERIGTFSEEFAEQARKILGNAASVRVEVMKAWYY